MVKTPSHVSAPKSKAKPVAMEPEPELFPESNAPPAPAEPVAPRERRWTRAASREGKKLLLTPIDQEVHRRLRHLAIDQDLTVEGLVRRAIDDYLRKHASKE